jgi:hypothetical protein
LLVPLLLAIDALELAVVATRQLVWADTGRRVLSLHVLALHRAPSFVFIASLDVVIMRAQRSELGVLVARRALAR